MLCCWIKAGQCLRMTAITPSVCNVTYRSTVPFGHSRRLRTNTNPLD